MQQSHLQIHGTTIYLPAFTPEKYKAYSYTKGELAQVVKIVSSARFKNWANQQTNGGGITTTLIRNSPTWDPLVLFRYMNWDTSALDIRCAAGMTVKDIILPKLYQRMVSIWEKHLKLCYMQNRGVPALPDQGEVRDQGTPHLVVRHDHIIHNRPHDLDQQFFGTKNHQGCSPTNLFSWLLCYTWEACIYQATWLRRTLCILLLFPCLVLQPHWYWRISVFFWQHFWQKLLVFVVWPLLQEIGFSIWKYQTIFASAEEECSSRWSLATPATPSHTTSSRLTKPLASYPSLKPLLSLTPRLRAPPALSTRATREIATTCTSILARPAPSSSFTRSPSSDSPLTYLSLPTLSSSSPVPSQPFSSHALISNNASQVTAPQPYPLARIIWAVLFILALLAAKAWCSAGLKRRIWDIQSRFWNKRRKLSAQQEDSTALDPQIERLALQEIERIDEMVKQAPAFRRR